MILRYLNNGTDVGMESELMAGCCCCAACCAAESKSQKHRYNTVTLTPANTQRCDGEKHTIGINTRSSGIDDDHSYFISFITFYFFFFRILSFNRTTMAISALMSSALLGYADAIARHCMSQRFVFDLLRMFH